MTDPDTTPREALSILYQYAQSGEPVGNYPSARAQRDTIAAALDRLDEYRKLVSKMDSDHVKTLAAHELCCADAARLRDRVERLEAAIKAQPCGVHCVRGGRVVACPGDCYDHPPSRTDVGCWKRDVLKGEKG